MTTAASPESDTPRSEGSPSRVLGPGATIGIVGGGQLAQMLLFEAHRMGYRVAILDPDAGAPAARLADVLVAAPLDDLDGASELARASDVVTLDTEHVHADVLDHIERFTPVRPRPHVLRTIQDRLTQRHFLASIEAPQVRFAAVSSLDELEAATATIGLPGVLKTRRSGYDGRGQARVDTTNDLEAAWARVGQKPCVYEAFVHFACEVSVVLGRNHSGEVRCFPLAENLHRHHILHKTRVPARVLPSVAAKAESLGLAIASALAYEGVLGIEFFVEPSGGLLVNELAPRTHNSGHYTYGAASTSQFEQHLRAICGLPLGDTTLLSPVVMLNLLGDLWHEGTFDLARALASSPRARVHLYGKAQPTLGRKMGHALLLDETADLADAAADALDLSLRGS